jgi:hypothetical protein
LFWLLRDLDNQDRLIAKSTSKTRVERSAVGIAVHNLAVQHSDVLTSKLDEEIGVQFAKALHLLKQRRMVVLAQKAVDQFLDDCLDGRLLLLRQRL